MEDIRIDCLQYANWSRLVFEQMRKARIDAVHVTIFSKGFQLAIFDWQNKLDEQQFFLDFKIPLQLKTILDC